MCAKSAFSARAREERESPEEEREARPHTVTLSVSVRQGLEEATTFVIKKLGWFKMTGVFESYEQQFATITADITVRIGRIPNLTGSECFVTSIFTTRLSVLYR